MGGVRMNLVSHEVFRAVVEQGSLAKATHVLHMAQSTASRHIQALEDEYGGLLFERSALGLTLTAFGRALYPYTCELLGCHRQAKDELDRLRQQGGGLIVGATLSIGETVLPGILGELRRQYPQSDIRMRVSNTSLITADLVGRRVDIALVEGRVEQAADLRVTVWREDELVLVCAPDHPFARAGEIRPGDLIGQPLLSREDGSGTRQATEEALDDAGLLPVLTFAMELGSNQAIKSAIMAGLGVAFLSRLTIDAERQAGRLIVVPLRDMRIVRHFCIVERSDRYAKFLVRPFVDLLAANAGG